MIQANKTIRKSGTRLTSKLSQNLKSTLMELFLHTEEISYELISTCPENIDSSIWKATFKHKFMDNPDNNDIGRGLTSRITINLSLDCIFGPGKYSVTPAEVNQFITVSQAGWAIV